MRKIDLFTVLAVAFLRAGQPALAHADQLEIKLVQYNKDIIL